MKRAPTSASRSTSSGSTSAIALHVAAVPGVQYLALHPLAHRDAVACHLRAGGEHGRRHLELLLEDRSRPLLLGELERGPPPGEGKLAAHVRGELERLRAPVAEPEEGARGAEAEEPHAVAPLVGDLAALLLERQPVDLHHVVEHSGEDGDRLAEALPVEAGVLGERLVHEAGQVHRSEEARAVGRQRLLAAVVDVEPVRVEGVDPGNRYVEDLGLSRGLDRPYGGREALAVEGAAVLAKRDPEPARLVGVVEPDHPVESWKVLAGDDELVLCANPVFARAAPAVGQTPDARLPAIAVEPRDDPGAKEHPLHLDEQPLVALRETNAHALSLIALHAAVRSRRDRGGSPAGTRRSIGASRG